jgi:hypothetical protein
VLELHAIATKKMEESAEFAVAMTMRERHRFFGDFNLERSFDLYTLWFDVINAEMSDCSRPEDRKSIHAWKAIAIATVSLLGKLEDGMHMIDDLLKNDTVSQLFAQFEQGGHVSGKCAYTNRVCSRFI